MGVFIYNGLKSAHMVPVPAREQGIATIATVVDSCWDVDMWITPFPSHPDVIWRKNMKSTAKFALFYYSVKTKVTAHRDALLCEPRIGMEEGIGDVLFLKVHDGAVVDMIDDDVMAVLKELDNLL